VTSAGRPTVRDAAFRALVHAATRGPIHPVPPVCTFRDGSAAFAAMQQAMADAREEILLETYILRDDRLGVAVREALAAAVARGVQVSVLADALGSWATRDAFWHAMTSAGVTVRFFHRLWHHPLSAHRRDHRKLLVVDRAVAFTGGMNIGEEYGSSLQHRADAFRDTLVRLTGPVVHELAGVFAEGWDRAGGPVLPGLERTSWTARIIQRWGPHGERRSARQGMDPSDGGLFVLDSRPGRGQRAMARVLAALIDGAREQLWITTPYFAPPRRAVRRLVAAAQRGVEVRLLLPGERTDVPIVRHAAHGTYARLLRGGVRIFEYQQAVLHAKTLVADGHAVLVGSSNLDLRSLRHNAECNVLLLDDGWGSALTADMVHDLEGSAEVTPAIWQQYGRWHRLVDRVAYGMRWAW
jgi:cardiolipin synthase